MLTFLICASAFAGALVAVYLCWWSGSAIEYRRWRAKSEQSHQEEMQRWREEQAAMDEYRKLEVSALREQVEKLCQELGVPVKTWQQRADERMWA